MLILLGMLVAGGLAGWWARDAARAVAANRLLARITIWALLAVMGAKLAQHRDLFTRDLSVFLLAIASSLLLLGAWTGLFLVVGALARRRRDLASLEADPAEPAGGGHELGAVGVNAGCIALGFVVFLLLPDHLAARIPVNDAATWALWALLVFVGFDLGVEVHHLDLRKLPPLLLLAPLGNIAFSLAFGALFGLVARHSAREGMLLTSGLGWYSLSSVLLAERGLVLLSILAFIHNVFRELFSILSAPLAARISPYLPVYMGGATTMDVMLPFIQRYCGREYTLVAFYSGVVCSVAVIPLVRLIAG